MEFSEWTGCDQVESVVTEHRDFCDLFLFSSHLAADAAERLHIKLSGRPPHALNVELDRLCKRQLMVRYARGKYGLPEAGTPEALLPCLDSGAYITGAYALYRHNLATQVPTEIVCFTNRRHGRARVR